jgi:hypothetical protein
MTLKGETWVRCQGEERFIAMKKTELQIDNLTNL